jgi:hypothetical protein
MMWRSMIWFSFLGAALALAGCGGDDADADGGADAGSDADTDADSDTDTDADTDTHPVGGACTVTVGPTGNTVDVAGTCQANMEACTAGYDPGDQSGTCAATQTCCIDLGQCEATMAGTCHASADECGGATPPGGFPMFGCPPESPVCCVPDAGGDGGPPGDAGPA